MAGEYVCIGIGTSSVHAQALDAYAQAFGLEKNTCGEYVCIGVGTGPLAPAHYAFLHAYAEAHNLPAQDSETSCP